jgi:hypothetical protein
MDFTVRALTLHRAIALPRGNETGDGTVAILRYRSLVAKGNLEPDFAEHLVRCDEGKAPEDATILEGYYLFTQGVSPLGERVARDPERAEAEATWRAAAEAVWLESLWRDVPFASDRIFVRVLSEDGKTVFQIFRELAAKE